MTAPLVEQIADAVLYEGYILYPYRSSAIKNRQRWNFGVVYPRSYSEAHAAGDAWEMETECLVSGGPGTTLSVRVRGLRLVDRVVGRLAAPVNELAHDADVALETAAVVDVGGEVYESWQEAAECAMELPDVALGGLVTNPAQQQFLHPATRTVEALKSETGLIAAAMVRTQQSMVCWVCAGADALDDCLYRVRIRISNTSILPCSTSASRDDALARSLLSAHTILRVRDGEFVSLLEPPQEFQDAAAACRNTGTWPVLVGQGGQRDTLLSSPIILYDYPQVAPESPGDLFDGAEIDEILSLRILALTDDEKDAMRRVDDRARRILERTESLPAEHFVKLHGALRGLQPSAGEEKR